MAAIIIEYKKPTHFSAKISNQLFLTKLLQNLRQGLATYVVVNNGCSYTFSPFGQSSSPIEVVQIVNELVVMVDDDYVTTNATVKTTDGQRNFLIYAGGYETIRDIDQQSLVRAILLEDVNGLISDLKRLIKPTKEIW